MRKVGNSNSPNLKLVIKRAKVNQDSFSAQPAPFPDARMECFLKSDG